jgi:GT2 family glycosyltransferase
VLPAGTAIHSCEQNPWETAHVLANGDVVACEVLDKTPLGNLFEQSISEIWNGEVYRRFRALYHAGAVAECRTCPWKRAYIPGPPAAEILGTRGRHAQLIYGWHDPCGEPHMWSGQEATAMLAPRAGANRLHVHGTLSPGNDLTVSCNGAEVGRAGNPTSEAAAFELDLPVDDTSETWRIDFRTRFAYRPYPDQRDLGFALRVLAARRRAAPAIVDTRERALEPLVRAIASIDRLGVNLRSRFGPRAIGQQASHAPGMSVIIPERDNVGELATCLESLRVALARFNEPSEVIVVVNGSPAENYTELRCEHPAIRWGFHRKPLAFSRAVLEGLRHARFDWVYLLNNDVALDPAAFRTLAPYRQDDVFAIGSQVFLKDRTAFRNETNWGALLIEDGLATIHDWIPRSGHVVEAFYTGGGASLFQTRLLRRLLDPAAYAPFYWEDVEWGWRARKLGYRNLLCPASVAWHRRQATISRCYTPAEVESTIERNRLLFQLRNFTTVGSVSRVIRAIAAAQDNVAAAFLRRRAAWEIGRGRLWNHMAPLTDEQVWASWDRASWEQSVSCG